MPFASILTNSRLLPTRYAVCVSAWRLWSGVREPVAAPPIAHEQQQGPARAPRWFSIAALTIATPSGRVTLVVHSDYHGVATRPWYLQIESALRNAAWSFILRRQRSLDNPSVNLAGLVGILSQAACLWCTDNTRRKGNGLEFR